MSQSELIALVMLALFLVFITARGELATYIRLLV